MINYLSTGLTGILALLQLLVALLVGLVVAPQGERLGAQRAGDGALVAGSLHVVVRRHFTTRHPAQVTAVPAGELVYNTGIVNG